jgi:cobaltochelatase CobS
VTVTVTNADRAALRRAIAAHPDWAAYRRTHGVDTSSLGAARALDVARHLGLDVSAILGRDAPAPTATPTAQDADTMPTPTPAVPAGLFDRRTSAAPATSAAAPAAGGVDAAALAQTITAAIAGALAGAGAGTSEALAALDARVGDLERAAPALLVLAADGARLGDELPPNRHPQLEDLILSVSARKPNGQRLNVWLAGPAGSGKTTAASMAAAALGLGFAAMGAMSQPHELVGFVDAAGHYHDTPFTRFYRDGGLCLLDEVDASDANVTLVLNGALDNGALTLPTGETIARHADFACVGAANTWGHGATAEFIGRNKLDGAFLDRWVRIAWVYDEAMETAVSGDPEWSRRVQRARAAASKAGLKILITPRASIHGAALIRAGMTPDRAARMTYLSGLTDAQITQVEGGK